ncbi:MAG: hypothetical protein FWD12_10440, partial [Alphaproteobacteria bacterium]|nr:hypothetical protein [Alphaproteobacteria bacterium]
MKALFLVAGAVFGGTATALAGPFSIVGGDSFDSLAQAVAAAPSGSTIDVTAGTYNDQSTAVPANDTLTIRSVGGLATFNAVSPLANTQGIIQSFGNLTVNGLQFENAEISDALGGNGAGIRYKSGSLTVENSVFSNNQEGILADPDPTGIISINHTEFAGNGNPTTGGLQHALYVGMIASLTVQNSNFTGTKGQGSNIQSLAANNIVKNNTMNDGTISDANYAVNIRTGGIATIAGNTIEKGPLTTNPIIIAYGADGPGALYSNNALTVTNNTFVSTDPNAVGIEIFSPADLTATLSPNTYGGTFAADIGGVLQQAVAGTSQAGAGDPLDPPQAAAR